MSNEDAGGLRGAAFVAVVQATELGNRDDAASASRATGRETGASLSGAR